MKKHGSLLALAVALGLFVACAMEAKAQTANPHGDKVSDCSACHAPDRWKPARIAKSYKHAPDRFPLYGAHAAAPCTSCHVSLDFSGTSPSCVSCHRDPHQGQQGVQCASCHTFRSFVDQSAMLRAHQATRFPLVGAHRTADCESCHQPTPQGQLRYSGRSTECVSCHMKDLQAAKNPDHVAANFPVQCGQCHAPTFWARAAFDHSATQFPLTGAHRTASCAACHADGVFRGKPTTCISCHQADYNGAKDPNHVAGGYPTNCASCHGTSSWNGASFDHSTTQFPLTGAHATVACLACHGDGVYAGKSTACVSCHLASYNATTDPNHASAGFSTNCVTCHTTTTWSSASFDHSQTSFPLTGLHVGLSCKACHADGVYAGKPTTCVSCHLTDYSSTTNPNHTAAHFPTTCETCHKTTGWPNVTWDHDGPYFPIYSGTHKGTWTSCANCHNNPADYAVFTCLTCHGQSQTNNQHQGVPNYRYTSSACYSCHPRGRTP